MPVRDVIQWVMEVLVRCGDDDMVREVVAQRVVGSAAPFVKKIVRGSDVSQPLMQQILQGVDGEDWKREVLRVEKSVRGFGKRDLGEDQAGRGYSWEGREGQEGEVLGLSSKVVVDKLLVDFKYEMLVEARRLIGQG